MPIAGNAAVAQAQLRYTWDSQEVENILYFMYPSSVTTEECQTLADQLAAWWAYYLDPLQSTTCTLREVYCKRMVSVAGPEATSVEGLPHAGSDTSPSMPNNVTASISFRTGLSGRAHRGRNYIIGLTEQQCFQNRLLPEFLEMWTLAYQNLLPTGGYISEATWCVYSQYLDGDLRGTGVATPVTTALFVNDVLDSQRRRLPGRGQ